MSDKEKSIVPGLSAAERKALRVQEAQEAIAHHEDAQKAFQENRERLRGERLVREAAEGPMVALTTELRDDTLIERVIFSTRIQNALRAAGLNTVGSSACGACSDLQAFGQHRLGKLLGVDLVRKRFCLSGRRRPR